MFYAVNEITQYANCVAKSAVWKKCHFFFPAENLVAVCKPRAVFILQKYICNNILQKYICKYILYKYTV